MQRLGHVERWRDAPLNMKQRFTFVVTFIDWSTEDEQTKHVRRVHTRYGEIIANVTGGMRERVCRDNI